MIPIVVLLDSPDGLSDHQSSFVGLSDGLVDTQSSFVGLSDGLVYTQSSFVGLSNGSVDPKDVISMDWTAHALLV